MSKTASEVQRGRGGRIWRAWDAIRRDRSRLPNLELVDWFVGAGGRISSKEMTLLGLLNFEPNLGAIPARWAEVVQLVNARIISKFDCLAVRSELSPRDVHFLEAAEGWLELGRWHDADVELDEISAVVQEHPDVLFLRIGSGLNPDCSL
jgi:hypothetical protein